MGGGSKQDVIKTEADTSPDASFVRAQADYILQHQAEIKTRTVTSVTVSLTSNREAIQSTEVQIPSNVPKDNKLAAFYQVLGETAGLGKLTPSIVPIKSDPNNPYFKTEGNYTDTDVKKRLAYAAKQVSDMDAAQIKTFVSKIEQNLKGSGPVANPETAHGASVVAKAASDSTSLSETIAASIPQLSPTHHKEVQAISQKFKEGGGHAADAFKINFEQATILDLQAPVTGGVKQKADSTIIKK